MPGSSKQNGDDNPSASEVQIMGVTSRQSSGCSRAPLFDKSSDVKDELAAQANNASVSQSPPPTSRGGCEDNSLTVLRARRNTPPSIMIEDTSMMETPTPKTYARAMAKAKSRRTNENSSPTKSGSNAPPTGIILLNTAAELPPTSKIPPSHSAASNQLTVTPERARRQSIANFMHDLRHGPRLKVDRGLPKQGAGTGPTLPTINSKSSGLEPMNLNAADGDDDDDKSLGGSSQVSHLGRPRRLVLISCALLQLFLLIFVSGVAVLATQLSEPGGRSSEGLGIWVALSGIMVLLFGCMAVWSVIRFRRVTKGAQAGGNGRDDVENLWIEMHERPSALPPRPQNGSVGGGSLAAGGQPQQEDEVVVSRAWKKFANDQEQLRKYVENLEDQLEAYTKKEKEGQGSLTQAPNDEYSELAPETHESIMIGIAYSTDDEFRTNASNTPRTERPVASFRSMFYRHQKPSTSAKNVESNNIIYQNDPNSTNDQLPRSDTKSSILSELCAAVTEPYSPLSATPNSQMPSSSPMQRSDGSPSSSATHGNANDTPHSVKKIKTYHLEVPDKPGTPSKTLRTVNSVQTIDIFNGKLTDV